MSTFASSVINKSSKKFAPKAPVRRAAPAQQLPSSSRTSVERHTPAPTAPQPSAPLEISSQDATNTVTQDAEAPLHAERPHCIDEPAESSEGSTPIPAPSRRLSIPSTAKPAAQLVQPTTVTPSEQPLQSYEKGGWDVTVDDTPPDTEAPTRKRRKVGNNATARGLTATIQESVVENHTAPDQDSTGDVTKAPTKRRSKSTRTITESVEAHADEAIADASEGARVKKKPRQKRLRTPENAEAVEISDTVVKMADLCKDLHTGKKSRREMALQSMNWADIARKKKERRAEALAMGSDSKKRGGAAQETPVPSSEQEPTSAPQMRIINGEIILDDLSTHINRHDRLDEDTADLEVLEENSLMETINSHTHMKKSDKVSWDEDNTDLFYRGLRMFGTDFGMIKRLFPDPAWSRRTIKLKFLNEERKRPQRVKATLMGPMEEVDLAELSRITDTVYEDPLEVDKVLAAERKKIEQEHARHKEEHDENLRQAEATAAAAKEAAESSAKENEVEGSTNPEEPDAVKKGRKSRSTKKRTQSKSVAFGEVEILESIEEIETPVEGSIAEEMASSTAQDAGLQTKNAPRKSSRAKAPVEPAATEKTAPRRKRVTAKSKA